MDVATACYDHGDVKIRPVVSAGWLQRDRGARLFCPARIDILPRSIAHAARRGRPLRSRRSYDRNCRWRKADRLARAAGGGQAGRPLFPRQWRGACSPCPPLSRSNRERQRARGAYLSRLWRLERDPDRSGAFSGRRRGLCVRDGALPGAANRGVWRVTRYRCRDLARCGKAGGVRRVAGALYLDRRRGRRCLSVLAGAAPAQG